MQFNSLKIAVMTAILSTTMSSMVFAAESTVAYASVLGKSSNPAPSSLGMPATASAMPMATMIGPNGTQLSDSLSNDYRRTTLPTTNVAAPAWAQGPLSNATSVVLRPFASNLFEGRFAGTFSDMTSSDYILAPGDRVVVRIWGARSYDDVLVVDQQGNLFLPEVGPIHVAGLRQGSLLSTVKQAIGRVFTDNVQVYVNLQSAQPVAVYVTGFVNGPGRYAGGSLDSIMSFIDRAGGIDAARGSYRHIEVIRNKKVVEKLDLYRFALEGTVPSLRLKNGDVILVKEKGVSVSAYGLLREQAAYEFSKPSVAKGAGLIELSMPECNVSHVSVTGTRNKSPFNRYFSIEEFKSFSLADGDIVEFVADKPGETIMATVQGAITGASRYPINKTMKLRDLLRQIEVEPELAAIGSIYLRRKSVARDQKVVIQDSLRRLEQTAMTATSNTPEEAQVRVKEAELIQDFVKRAAQLEPDGVVVVSRRGQVSDLWLEDGDEIVIPQKSNVILITGEVMLPKTVAYEPMMTLDDYLALAGGVTPQANEKQVLIAKQNGEVMVSNNCSIEPGDRILVLPKTDSKGLLLAKDIMQVVYQIAVATKIAIDI